MLEAQNVLFDLAASTQKEVIEKVVAKANELGKIADVAKTVDAVATRELESSTGFGKGVAIPHGKTDGVKEPVLMFAKLANPVEWNSLDGKPVDMLFMILVPETSQNEHLQILAKLARRLMHDDFVSGLREFTDAASLTNFIKEQLA